jgi:hypothetical protein
MKLKLLLALLVLSSITVNAQYCTPDYLLGCALGDEINTFVLPGSNATQINSINTGCSVGNYVDSTVSSVEMYAGGSYTATINCNAANDFIQVYIDFNNDQAFAGTESVGGTNYIAIAPTTSTFAIFIPAGTTPGTYRMRVVLSGDSTYPHINPCPWNAGMTGYGTGEVHDYTAIILDNNCVIPTNIHTTMLFNSSAHIDWDIVVGATDYEYVNNQVAADPTGPGLSTSTNGQQLYALSSNTTYYFHLRTHCGDGNFSDWVTFSFTTPACPVPLGLSTSGVTAYQADAHWDWYSGQPYLYDVSTAASPQIIGAYMLAPIAGTFPLTGLSPGTTYHLWARYICDVGDTSAWSSMHTFTTLPAPVSVVNVAGADFTLQVYPNPAKNVLAVAALGKGNNTATIQLTDVTGKLLNSYTLNTEEMNIDMSGLSSGVYFIRYADDMHRQTIKVNKE